VLPEDLSVSIEVLLQLCKKLPVSRSVLVSSMLSGEGDEGDKRLPLLSEISRLYIYRILFLNPLNPTWWLI
jgi:hypothetical protein